MSIKVMRRVKKKRCSSSIDVKDYKEDIFLNPSQCDPISDKDFFIPNYEQYELLSNYNYKIKQLQKICKFYKQKTTGKKIELLNDIYHYLKMSFFSNKIQKVIRGYLLRQHNYLRGPAYFKRSICNNETDFLTLENVKDIDKYQFISFTNSEGFVYGFDIVSLYNLILKNGTKAMNPYDRRSFPSRLISDIKKLNLLTKTLHIKMTISIETEKVQDRKKNIEFRLISLFQKIDEFGFITDINWFNQLTRVTLIRYMRELSDIWNYRAQLSQETKRSICPPHGNPFMYMDNNRHHYISVSIDQLKISILKVMECMVTSGVNESQQHLGAFYVLSALTLVNEDASASLPWLYQSVMHT